ncbi:MAG: DNA translocase FtsK [Candidatus Paceibacterota bacterium]
MAKKKKGRKKKSKGKKDPVLKPEVRTSVWAILSFAAGIFFILAGIGKAGLVGTKLHTFLTYLLGTGYFLFPAFFFIVVIALIKREDTDLALPRIAGALLFLLSGLGLVEILFADRGGLLGGIITSPLISLFDFYASLAILITLILIAIVLIAEHRIRLETLAIWRSWWGEKGEEETTGEQEAFITPSPEPEPRDDEEEQQEKKGFSISNFARKKEETSDDDADTPALSVSASGKEYKAPPVSLLDTSTGKPSVGDVKANANLIKRTLANFGINVEMDEISIGPTVTRYALKPAEGVRLSKIVGLQNNLELALAAYPVRIEAPIPGKALVGIEVPNTSKAIVRLAELLSSSEYKKSDKPLLISLGKGISGNTRVADLGKAPHILIAGATGSGKSVTIHTLLNSLIYRNSPDMLKFIMVDPKRVELTLYDGIPHLLTPVITDAKKSILALKWTAKEMERRYDILQDHTVRDINSYHNNVLPKLQKKYEKNKEKNEEPYLMPYIVVVIDELADLMTAYPRELESAIVRLAQMSRAVGIHLVLSTQRPSVNVITGLIKANIPTRIALQVSSQVDSRTILDGVGAEKLLGAGDMLYQSGDMSKPVRLQSAFISEKEVKSVVQYLKDQYEDLADEINITDNEEKDVEAIFESIAEEEERDDLYEEARDIVIRAGKGSTSYLQRKLRIGYARAASIMDQLEESGVVGEQEGSRAREVLVEQEEYEEAREELEEDES